MCTLQRFACRAPPPVEARTPVRQVLPCPAGAQVPDLQRVCLRSCMCTPQTPERFWIPALPSELSLSCSEVGVSAGSGDSDSAPCIRENWYVGYKYNGSMSQKYHSICRRHSEARSLIAKPRNNCARYGRLCISELLVYSCAAGAALYTLVKHLVGRQVPVGTAAAPPMQTTVCVFTHAVTYPAKKRAIAAASRANIRLHVRCLR